MESSGYEESVVYRFGGFELNAARGELTCGGAQVRIRPRSFDVLRYLVEHPGRLVSREELLDKIWGTTVVTDDAVTQCITDIRRVLGDDRQTLIRTVPRRGYILEIPVEAFDTAATGPQAPTAERRSGGLTAVRAAVGLVVVLGLAAMFWGINEFSGSTRDTPAAASVAPGAPSIAVLPFAPLSPDRKPSWFADGVSEEILNLLARQSGLRVIARTSSFSFRGAEADIMTIAEQLGVTHVLEGSVRSEGKKLRISVQLVDAATGEYVWTDSYDRELTASGVFAVQSEVAQAVVDALSIELTAEDRARLSANAPDNLPALEAYFEAKQAMESRRPAALERAVALLERATREDPGFALAHVALADALRLLSGYGGLNKREANMRGKRAVETALALDDTLGEAYASLANLLRRAGDIDGAERAYLRGITLSPSYAPLYQWYGEFLLFYAGRPDEAVAYTRLAAALDPRSPIILSDYAEALTGVDRADDALAQYDKALEIDGTFAVAFDGKGVVLHRLLGRPADAIPNFEAAARHSPGSPNPPVYLAYAYNDLGDLEAARRFTDAAFDIAPRSAHPHLPNLILATQSGATAAALASASVLAEAWGGFAFALRVLRNDDVARGDLAGAVDRYARYYPELLSEQVGSVNGYNYRAAIDLAWVLRQLGRDERAEQLLVASSAQVGNLSRVAYGISDARIEAIRGDTDRALALLSEAVDAGWRFHWRFELLHDPALAALRDDPRFDVIVDAIRSDMNTQREQLRATISD